MRDAAILAPRQPSTSFGLRAALEVVFCIWTQGLTPGIIFCLIPTQRHVNVTRDVQQNYEYINLHLHWLLEASPRNYH